MNQTNIKKNSVVEIEITGMSTDGKGIGKTESGFAVFIPETAIGDKVMAKIVKVNKNYAFGIVESIEKQSEHRICSDCDVFSKCGGCCFRHISYEHELEIKQDFVKNNITRIGGINDVEVMPVHPSPAVDHYRNKSQYPIGRDNDGNVVIGFFAKRSHRIVDNSFCKLQPEFFADIVLTLKKFITENNVSVYDEKTHTGLFRHLFIRHAVVTNEVMVCLIINGKSIPKSDLLIDELLKSNKNISSVTLNINKQPNNVILGKKVLPLYGKPHITDELCGLTFDISPLSFYQINHDSAQNLYSIAASMAELKGDEILVDLYCGTGTIGLTMADKVKLLIGVDVVPDAIENAKQNAKQNDIENAWFICGDAKFATSKLKSQQLSPDVVILDPPRKGCDMQVLEQVSLMQPKKIVMISCDSATLSRDLKVLTGLGYVTKKIQPVDMFPRTNHVECVVFMTRTDK